MSFTRTIDLIAPSRLAKLKDPLLYGKTGSSYEEWTGTKITTRVLCYCGYLKNLGLKSGDKIILLPESASPEWVMLDLATQALGIIVVMAHASGSSKSVRLIIHESEAKHFIYANEELIEGLGDIFDGIALQQLYDIPVDQTITLNEYKQACETIKEEDLACIIYTSGTTGDPKGVMLTHANIMSNVQSVTLLMPICRDDRVLSMLPYSHVFERTSVYCLIALQSKIYFIDSPQNLAEALTKIKPHYFTAVPRILEKMYDQVIAAFRSRKWLGKTMFKWAGKFTEDYQPHKAFNPIKFVQLQFIRYILLGRFRKKMGGHLKGIITGAAHLRPEIARAFYAGGIKVREGYGMTETSPVISFNRFEPGLCRIDTVGLLLPQVRLEIRSKNEEGHGEIWVSGPNVMQGYYKKPEETGKVLIDGWLNTGDIGKLVKGRFLQITDRKKDIFKTSSGKYVAPQELENHFSQSELIENILVLGFQKAYVTALIYPNYEELKAWARTQDIHWTSPQYMALNIKVKERVQEEINLWNENLAKHKKVRAFHLMAEPWSQAQGQLSATLKPIRKKILEDYEKEIKGLYEKGASFGFFN